MKTTKRILAVLLAALMALGVFAIAASAGSDFYPPAIIARITELESHYVRIEISHHEGLPFFGPDSFLPEDIYFLRLHVFGPNRRLFNSEEIVLDDYTVVEDGRVLVYEVGDLLPDTSYALQFEFTFDYYGVCGELQVINEFGDPGDGHFRTPAFSYEPDTYDHPPCVPDFRAYIRDLTPTSARIEVHSTAAFAGPAACITRVRVECTDRGGMYTLVEGQYVIDPTKHFKLRDYTVDSDDGRVISFTVEGLTPETEYFLMLYFDSHQVIDYEDSRGGQTLGVVGAPMSLSNGFKTLGLPEEPQGIRYPTVDEIMAFCDEKPVTGRIIEITPTSATLEMYVGESALFQNFEADYWYMYCGETRWDVVSSGRVPIDAAGVITVTVQGLQPDTEYLLRMDMAIRTGDKAIMFAEILADFGNGLDDGVFRTLEPDEPDEPDPFAPTDPEDFFLPGFEATLYELSPTSVRIEVKCGEPFFGADSFLPWDCYYWYLGVYGPNITWEYIDICHTIMHAEPGHYFELTDYDIVDDYTISFTVDSMVPETPYHLQMDFRMPLFGCGTTVNVTNPDANGDCANGFRTPALPQEPFAPPIIVALARELEPYSAAIDLSAYGKKFTGPDSILPEGCDFVLRVLEHDGTAFVDRFVISDFTANADGSVLSGKLEGLLGATTYALVAEFRFADITYSVPAYIDHDAERNEFTTPSGWSPQFTTYLHEVTPTSASFKVYCDVPMVGEMAFLPGIFVPHLSGGVSGSDITQLILSVSEWDGCYKWIDGQYVLDETTLFRITDFQVLDSEGKGIFFTVEGLKPETKYAVQLDIEFDVPGGGPGGIGVPLTLMTSPPGYANGFITPALPEPPQPQPQSFTDPNSGVTIDAPAGALPDGVTLVVTSVPNANFQAQVEGNIRAAYEIHFKDSNGRQVQPTGPVTVKLPKPAQGTSFTIVHIKADNTRETLTATVSGDWLIFTTNSFSTFLAVSNDNTPAPKWWETLPAFVQFILRWFLFGFIWMK